MIIYVSHSRDFDYQNNLYLPLRSCLLSQTHTIILPHEISQEQYNSKELFMNKKCDLVLAEISHPATGQGIELGWANLLNIPIYCIYKKGQDVSGSALSIAKKTIKYIDAKDMIETLSAMI